MALSVEDVRARVETDLDDATLLRILRGCEQDVDRSAGKAASQVDSFEALGARFVALHRRSASITSVTERASLYSDPADTLAADDYRLVGSYKLLRLSSGTNARSRWGLEVVVTYVPEVDAELRDRVITDLCQMDVEFRALDSEEVGDWEGTQKDYKARRRELLKQVREGRSVVF